MVGSGLGGGQRSKGMLPEALSWSGGRAWPGPWCCCHPPQGAQPAASCSPALVLWAVCPCSRLLGPRGSRSGAPGLRRGCAEPCFSGGVWRCTAGAGGWCPADCGDSVPEDQGLGWGGAVPAVFHDLFKFSLFLFLFFFKILCLRERAPGAQGRGRGRGRSSLLSGDTPTPGLHPRTRAVTPSLPGAT